LQQEEYAGYLLGCVRPLGGYGTCGQTDTCEVLFNTKIKGGSELDADAVLSVLVCTGVLFSFVILSGDPPIGGLKLE